MTESEWLSCTDPRPMFTWVRGKVSERKLRLFACACAWRFEHYFPDPCCRQAVLVAERLAEGEANPDEVESAREPFFPLELELLKREGPDYAAGNAARWTVHGTGLDSAREVSNQCRAVAAHIASPLRRGQRRPPNYAEVVEAAVRAEWMVQADLLRDVVGIPSKRWLKRMKSELPSTGLENVTRLAQAVWQDRDFSALPVLADALEEAGCTSEAILGHLRQGGGHARGCWVLDLILGRE